MQGIRRSDWTLWAILRNLRALAELVREIGPLARSPTSGCFGHHTGRSDTPRIRTRQSLVSWGCPVSPPVALRAGEWLTLVCLQFILLSRKILYLLLFIPARGALNANRQS